MASLRNQLGPLTALVAFEAAGRLGSFTRAGGELSVSQVAVSKQVQGLEADLGVRLFSRLHRRVELTADGRRLFEVVSRALHEMAETVSSLRGGAEPRPVTIAATLAMSHFWLLPRLPLFQQAHPEISVRILAQDEPVNLRSGLAGLAIRFGDGKWRDGHATLLFDGEIYPVASPRYLAGRPPLERAEDLLGEALIGCDKLDPTWVDWPDWFAGCGLGGRMGPVRLQCSRYADAISAAVLGQGIALAWKGGTMDLEARGELVRLTQTSLRARDSFFLVEPDESTPQAQAFADWIRAGGGTADPAPGLSPLNR